MNKNRIYPRYFAYGALIIYFVFFFLPGLIGVGYSFTDWSAYSDELHYVGFLNFKTVFSADENYMKIITNTLEFTLITTILKNVIGLILALLLTKSIRLLNMHRGIHAVSSVHTHHRHDLQIHTRSQIRASELLFQIHRSGYARTEMAGIIRVCFRFGHGR